MEEESELINEFTLPSPTEPRNAIGLLELNMSIYKAETYSNDIQTP